MSGEQYRGPWGADALTSLTSTIPLRKETDDVEGLQICMSLTLFYIHYTCIPWLSKSPIATSTVTTRPLNMDARLCNRAI